MTHDRGILQCRAVFLWIAFTLPAAATIGHAVAPGRAIFKGHDSGVVVGVLVTLLVVLAWWPYRRSGRWTRGAYIFLGLVAAAWLFQITSIQLDQSVFNLTVVAVPVVLAAVALKPVSSRDLNVALLCLGYSLVAISLVSLLLGAVGGMPDGFASTDSGWNRLIPTQWLGIETRWGGPFGSVNYASPIGGLVAIIGISQKGIHRWFLALAGVTILSLGQARTTIFALGCALLIIVLWSPMVARMNGAKLIRAAVIAAAGVLGIVYVIYQDSTLAGRTPIWSDFTGLWMSSPLQGVGSSGVLAFVAERSSDPNFVPHTHAHSVLLDGAVRYGAIFAALILAVYLSAFLIALRVLRSGNAGPLSIVVFVIVAGLTETIHSWEYWSAYLAALMWSVLSTQSPTHLDSRESTSMPTT